VLLTAASVEAAAATPAARATVGHLGPRPAFAALLLAVTLSAEDAHPNTLAFATTVSAGVSERYDNNVMLQNEGPLARIESWVTAVQPVAGLDWRAPEPSTLTLGLNYAPDFTFFHARDEESYLRHVGVFNLDFHDEQWAARALARAQFTDGSTEGPTWSTPEEPGTTPALGAAEIRYRRRNFFWHSPLDARYNRERGYVRGVFEARLWDIMTDFKTLPGYGYQNYADRTDVNGGGEFGMKPARGWEVGAGYRFGHQDQERLPRGVPYTYQNDYHRLVGALSATPVKWLRCRGEIGPSFHQFNPAGLPAGADPTEMLMYFQAQASVAIGRDTSFKAEAFQHLLPSTAGRAAFQNIRATGTLDHRFSPKLRGTFRFDLQEYDYVRGLDLRDEVFTAETRLDYAAKPWLAFSAWCAWEWAVNLRPGITGREYDRQVIGVGVTVKR